MLVFKFIFKTLPKIACFLMRLILMFVISQERIIKKFSVILTTTETHVWMLDKNILWNISHRHDSLGLHLDLKYWVYLYRNRIYMSTKYCIFLHVFGLHNYLLHNLVPYKYLICIYKILLLSYHYTWRRLL